MKKLFRRFIIFVLVSSLIGVSAIGITYLVLEPNLPDVETLRDIQLQVPLRVFSEDGKLLGIFGEKRRIPVTVAEMPDHLKDSYQYYTKTEMGKLQALGYDKEATSLKDAIADYIRSKGYDPVWKDWDASFHTLKGGGSQGKCHK